jgi:hypothetical protein
MIAGLVTFLAGLVAGYVTVAIAWPANLPAPAIARLVHLDEKLRFIRRHPGLDPIVLAVGSSITWRQLDGAAFGRQPDGQPVLFNGATGALKIHQTADLTAFYLPHFPKVKTVLVMTNQEDFSDCTNEPAAMLDHDSAAAYAFDDWPAVYFYFRFFSPQRYVRTAWMLGELRRPLIGDLYLDSYGSGPLSVPESMKRGLRYKPVDTDPSCLRALVELSHRLTRRKLRLVVVFPPVHPAYRRAHPSFDRWTENTVRRLAAETAGDRTLIMPLYDYPGFTTNDFIDAYHLQWPAVRRLSPIIANALADTGDEAGDRTARAAAPIEQSARKQPAVDGKVRDEIQ